MFSVPSQPGKNQGDHLSKYENRGLPRVDFVTHFPTHLLSIWLETSDAVVFSLEYKCLDNELNLNYIL